jgi:hypothetical protein
MTTRRKDAARELGPSCLRILLSGLVILAAIALAILLSWLFGREPVATIPRF